MAFSFSRRKKFSRADFHRRWLEIGARDKALRNTAIFGFIAAYAVGAVIAGDLPPKKELLAPNFYLGQFDFMPMIAVVAVIFYFLAWTADEYPRGSRTAIVIFGALATCTYVVSLAKYQPESYNVRIGFLLYLVAVPVLAALQRSKISSNSEVN